MRGASILTSKEDIPEEGVLIQVEKWRPSSEATYDYCAVCYRDNAVFGHKGYTLLKRCFAESVEDAKEKVDKMANHQENGIRTNAEIPEDKIKKVKTVEERIEV